jgi:hypothetical protein
MFGCLIPFVAVERFCPRWLLVGVMSMVGSGSATCLSFLGTLGKLGKLGGVLYLIVTRKSSCIM